MWSPAQTDRSPIRLRPDEAATLETFGEQTETIAIPPEQLHQIAALSAKDEDMAGVRILFELPDEWLLPEPSADTPDAKRAGYLEYFLRRLDATPSFVEEALHARARLV